MIYHVFDKYIENESDTFSCLVRRQTGLDPTAWPLDQNSALPYDMLLIGIPIASISISVPIFLLIWFNLHDFLIKL